MAVTMFPEFYPNDDGRLQVRVGLNEGTMTVAKGNTALGSVYTYSFASACQGVDVNAGYQVGDKVVSDGIDADGRLLVKKHVYNDSLPVIGEIMSKIDFNGVPSTTVGTIAQGSYTPREATILFYGGRIRTLKAYMAQSASITAGMYMIQNAVTGYEDCVTATGTSGTVASSRVALAAATASGSTASTAKIAVLEVFEGN